MIQVNGTHLLGALLTLIMSVGGGAFTVYDSLSSQVDKIETRQNSDRELMEVKLQYLADTQAEILEEVKQNRTTRTR